MIGLVLVGLLSGAAMAGPDLEAETVAVAAVGGGNAIRRAAAEVRANNPDLANAVVMAIPTPTRGGALRMVGAPEGRDAAAIHLELALFGAEPEEVRAARVRAAILDVPQAWRALVWISPSDRVRRAAASALHQDPDSGPDLARAALNDPDPGVREIAVASLSRLPTGGTFGKTYAEAALDPEARVRAFAIRALGWWRLNAQEGVVDRAVSDVDARVREAAVQAKARLR